MVDDALVAGQGGDVLAVLGVPDLEGAVQGEAG